MNAGEPRTLPVKLQRFAIVGVLNSAIDFAAFTGLVFLDLHPVLANVLAWAVAVVFSFAVNSRWTFVRSERFDLTSAFAKFALSGSIISLGSSTIAVLLLPPLTGVFPAKLIGIAVGAALNFFAARWSIEDRIL
ncbi:GtrA family protein [Nitratireductor sp. ZSWI3]|uniref:GtrA family protein n=1 Tax=Nitratireductor sp. ZSWI3 TaxID=2966359 RepID=UPI0021501941|nr:GtrA family protein [Nitratireductor sp. ZSWI3]MCR4268974.1 GtrA family protein [Nitratireductor sp. ZSWI3]